MPLVGTMEEALTNRRGKPISSKPGERDSATVMRSDLIPDPGEEGDYSPNCKLIEQGAHSVIRPHFHVVDQFQLVTAGGGVFGRDAAQPLTVHFASAYTGYGPIIASEAGLDYMVFRTGIDRGAAYMPESRAKMRDGAKRHKTIGPIAPLAAEGSPAPRERSERVIIEAEPDGLAASLLWLPSAEKFTGRPPAEGGGQFYYIQSGTIVFEGRELIKSGTIYVGPEEASVKLSAGPKGAELLYMQFPQLRV